MKITQESKPNKFITNARLFELYSEKQMICGDGTSGEITSHSINCRCKEIDEEINRLLNET
jgi:hypothetical protein